MEARNIFLMVYILVFQFTDLHAFHLDGIKKIDEKNLKFLHSPEESLTSNETISSSVTESKPLSTAKYEDGPHVKNNEDTKVHGKHWPAAKNVFSEKSPNIASHPKRQSIKGSEKPSLYVASHPKRQPINHPTWHKISKEPRKFSAMDNGRENGFHGFDVVVVDIPSSYSRAPWENPRLNSFTSPSLRYAPINRSPSIFDLLLGLDSLPENVLTEPAVMGNEVYFQRNVDEPWNRHSSFGRILSPTVTQPKAMNGVKDVSTAQLFGKINEPEPAKNCTCICEERKKFP